MFMVFQVFIVYIYENKEQICLAIIIRPSAFFVFKLQPLGFYLNLYNLMCYNYLYLRPQNKKTRIRMVASSITGIKNQEIYVGTNKFVYNP